MVLDLEKPGKMARFTTQIRAIPKRLLISLLPPLKGTRAAKVEVDLFGPILVVAALWALIEWERRPVAFPPILAIGSFFLAVPFMSFFLLYAGVTNLTLRKVLGLLGYAQFGHFCTLIAARLSRTPNSHAAFFTAFTIFGGLSAVRLTLVFIFSAKRPALVMLAGCLACVPHLLFIIFTYFYYIPRIK